MRRLMEPLVFTGLALGLHAMFLSGVAEQGGAAAGAGGAQRVTFVGAQAQAAMAVQNWTRSPDAQQVAMALQSPVPVKSSTAEMPLLHRDVAPHAVVSVPVQAKTIAPKAPRPVTKAAVPTPVKKAPVKPPAKPKPKTQPAAAKPATAQTASVSQRAAGDGDGVQSGNRGGAKISAQSKGKQLSLRRAWGSKIRGRIARQKRQPTKGRGPAKMVLVVVVSRAGELMSARVAVPSGKPDFDRAALMAANRAGRLPKAPKGLNAARYTFKIPLRFDR